MENKFLVVTYDNTTKDYHNDIVITENIDHYINNDTDFDISLYGRIITNIIKLN